MTPEIKKLIDSIEPANKKYEQEFAKYERDLNAYNRGVEQYNNAYREWEAKADAYNRAVEDIQRKENIYNQYATVYNEYMLNRENAPDFNQWVKNPIIPGDAEATRIAQFKLGRDPGNPRSTVNPFPGSPDSWMSSLPTRPAEWKGKFTGVEPVAPKLGYDPVATEEKLRPLREAQEDTEKYGKQRQLALEVFNDPEAYNLSGFGMAAGGPVVKMAQGGDPVLQALLKEFDQYMVKNQPTKAQILLDDTIDRYGLNMAESYSNIVNHLKANYPAYSTVTIGNLLENRKMLQPVRDYVNMAFQEVLGRPVGKEGTVFWTDHFYTRLGGPEASKYTPGGKFTSYYIKNNFPGFLREIAFAAQGEGDQRAANAWLQSKGQPAKFNVPLKIELPKPTTNAITLNPGVTANLPPAPAPAPAPAPTPPSIVKPSPAPAPAPAPAPIPEPDPVATLPPSLVKPLPLPTSRPTLPTVTYETSETNPYGFGRQSGPTFGVTRLWKNKKTGDQIYLSGGRWVPPKGQEDDWTTSTTDLPSNWDQIKKEPLNDYTKNKPQEEVSYDTHMIQVDPVTGGQIFVPKPPPPPVVATPPLVGGDPNEFVGPPSPSTGGPVSLSTVLTGGAVTSRPTNVPASTGLTSTLTETGGGQGSGLYFPAAGQGYQMQMPTIPTLSYGQGTNSAAKVPLFQVPGSAGYSTASNNAAKVPIIVPAMREGGDPRTAMERVRQFLQAMDVTPLDALYAMGRGGAGAAIGLTPSGLNENEDELLARYRAMAERERSTTQPPMARAEGSPPYGEDVDMQMFGDTGDRSMAEAKKGFGRSVDAIRRGVQYSPADLLGAPVDVINMALEPFGLGSEKPFLGSEYLIDKGVQAGIYEPPTGEGEETAARFAAGMINPTLGPRAVGKVAEGIESIGETPPIGAIKPRGGIMELKAQSNRMGGVTEPSVPAVVDSVAKAALLSQKDGMGKPLSQDHIDDIINFVEKKYGDYLMKDFGTENDPLRKAIISGRMYKVDVKDPDTGEWRKEQRITKSLSPVFARDSELYATVDDIQELVLAKKFAETNPEEFAKLASNPESKLYGYSEDSLQGSIDYKTNAANMYYDLLTNIQPVVYMNDRTLGKVDEVDFRDIVKSFTKFPNIDAATTANALELKQLTGITDEGIAAAKRMADSLVKSAKLMEAEGADRPLESLLSNMYIQRVHNPKNITFEAAQKAIDNEIVFKLGEGLGPMLGSLSPDEIVKTLSLVDRNKLKNMSFGQAMVDGLKKIESTRNFNEVIINTRTGKAVPREKLFLFTTPMQQVGSGRFGRQWVKLDDSRQAEVEGNLMKHSVGGYNKDERYNLGGKTAFDEGAVKLFSLRSMETGKPSVTVEYGHYFTPSSNKYDYSDEDLIRQVRGPFNSAPVSDIAEILKFADQNNLKFHKEALNRYDMDRTGNRLDAEIEIRWGLLQEAYKKPDFEIVAYKPYPEEIVISSKDDPIYKNFPRATDVKFAKGGMVDKPLYDRAA